MVPLLLKRGCPVFRDDATPVSEVCVSPLSSRAGFMIGCPGPSSPAGSREQAAAHDAAWLLVWLLRPTSYAARCSVLTYLEILVPSYCSSYNMLAWVKALRIVN